MFSPQLGSDTNHFEGCKKQLVRNPHELFLKVLLATLCYYKLVLGDYNIKFSNLFFQRSQSGISFCKSSQKALVWSGCTK